MRVTIQRVLLLYAHLHGRTRTDAVGSEEADMRTDHNVLQENVIRRASVCRYQ